MTAQNSQRRPPAGRLPRSSKAATASSPCPARASSPVLDALHDTPADRDRRLPPGRRRGVHGLRRRGDDRPARRVPSSPAAPARPTPRIGVHVAFQDSQPMILFVGDVARAMRDREGFQEVDFPALFAPVAKWAARIDDAGAHPRIRRPRLCHRDLRPARPGRARAARGHAARGGRGAAPRPQSSTPGAGRPAPTRWPR